MDHENLSVDKRYKFIKVKILILHNYDDENHSFPEKNINFIREKLIGKTVGNIHKQESIWISIEPIIIDFNGKVLKYNVEIKSPIIEEINNSYSKNYIITSSTQIILFSRWQLTLPNARNINLSYFDKTLVTELSVLFHNFFHESDNNSQYVSSVLINGARGSGKTSLVSALSNKFKAIINVVRAGELMARYYKEGHSSPSQLLVEVFKSSIVTHPSILLFEDLDNLIHDTSSNVFHEEIIKTISQILSFETERKVFVIGCTTSLDKFSLRIQSQFKKLLHIPYLNTSSVKRLLPIVLSSSLKENTAEYNNNNNNNNNNDEAIIPKLESFLQRIPSMTICKLINVMNVLVNDSGDYRQLIISNCDPQFSSRSPVCGHVNEKKQLMEALVWPRKYLPLFHLYKMNPINGILLFGPPGTGKTLLAKACSEELNYALQNVRLSDIIKGHIGSGEKQLRLIFQEAKISSPSIIFIDEFQAIFNMGEEQTKSSLSSTLTSCFDDLNIWNSYSSAKCNVVVIAATNEPWAIDHSFLRPGRLEKYIYIGPLDSKGRCDLIQFKIDEVIRELTIHDRTQDDDPLSEETKQITDSLLPLTEGYTGADIDFLVRKSIIQIRSIYKSEEEERITKHLMLKTCLELLDTKLK